MALTRVTNCWRFVISETRREPKSGVSAFLEALILELKKLSFSPALKILPAEPKTIVSSVDRDIREFLAGETNGAALLHALYDYVLDEPVPERLRAPLRR